MKPVVYGASFGGMVAMTYTTRHPEHAGNLVLVSTFAQAIIQHKIVVADDAAIRFSRENY